MSNLPKWTDERTEQLAGLVGTAYPVTQDVVASAAVELGTTNRSIASKLRKMGYEVESAAANRTSAFSDSQKATLRSFVESNSGTYTYAQIADAFEDGAFSAKEVQGKILSMELTSHVKAAPKPESTRTYSPEEEVKFVKMVNDGAFVEQIAEAMGRRVNSVRGKALSLLRSGEIEGIPKQEHTKDPAEKADPFVSLVNIAEMTVEDIAEAIGKTVRGVKTMLTRRGLKVNNYDGAAKKEKASSK